MRGLRSAFWTLQPVGVEIVMKWGRSWNGRVEEGGGGGGGGGGGILQKQRKANRQACVRVFTLKESCPRDVPKKKGKVFTSRTKPPTLFP